jgi:amino acid adenylation domain-containing protein
MNDFNPPQSAFNGVAAPDQAASPAPVYIRRDREYGLASGFLRSTELYPERLAVEVAGTSLTYRALYQAASSIAASIGLHTPSSGPPLSGVFAARSTTAYAGVLGALLAGHGYVPLNPAFPPDRTATMLARSECRTLIVDAAAEPQLRDVLGRLPYPMLVMLPDFTGLCTYAEQWPRHMFIGAQELSYISPGAARPPSPAADSVAYLLFTSGSTGMPKGVAVAHRNVVHFVEETAERYAITQFDRFSQTFDLTFDLSAFDMFLAWERGACVCCPSRKALLNPAQFIRDSQLTVWFSVPSVGLMMRGLGSLKPSWFPTLRWSLFCGEPLPADLAAAWAEAAPQSTLENLYGPTELTIACTAYRWDRRTSPPVSDRNIVPIGYPLPGMEALIADPALREVSPGEEGELLMTGPQLSLGYWREPEKTTASFVMPPGKCQTYYRTGDRVCRPMGDGPMHFRGRLDHQIKVQGYRVELQEVEALLKQEAGADLAVALGWPLTPSGAGGIEAFLTSPHQLDIDNVRERLKAKLPRYAVPRRIHIIDRWPLNSNGKIDRKQLIRLLEARV